MRWRKARSRRKRNLEQWIHASHEKGQRGDRVGSRCGGFRAVGVPKRLQVQQGVVRGGDLAVLLLVRGSGVSGVTRRMAVLGVVIVLPIIIPEKFQTKKRQWWISRESSKKKKNLKQSRIKNRKTSPVSHFLKITIKIFSVFLYRKWSKNWAFWRNLSFLWFRKISASEVLETKMSQIGNNCFLPGRFFSNEELSFPSVAVYELKTFILDWFSPKKKQQMSQFLKTKNSQVEKHHLTYRFSFTIRDWSIDWLICFLVSISRNWSPNLVLPSRIDWLIDWFVFLFRFLEIDHLIWFYHPKFIDWSIDWLICFLVSISRNWSPNLVLQAGID